MGNINKIDNNLCRSWDLDKKTTFNTTWQFLKNELKILSEAIEVDEYTVKGLMISHLILLDYETVNKEIYNRLVETVYSNVDVARSVVEGASNGGYSFLLMTLWNKNLKLTYGNQMMSYIMNHKLLCLLVQQLKQYDL